MFIPQKPVQIQLVKIMLRTLATPLPLPHTFSLFIFYLSHSCFFEPEKISFKFSVIVLKWETTDRIAAEIENVVSPHFGSKNSALVRRTHRLTVMCVSLYRNEAS